MDAFRPHGEIIDGNQSLILELNINCVLFFPCFNLMNMLFSAVRVICDHVSGESKGYGFVSFTSEIAAERALKEMNGQVIYFDANSFVSR